MKIKNIILLSLSFLFLVGCASFRDSLAVKAGYEKKSKVEEQIQILKLDKETSLKKQEQEITKAKDDDIRALRALFQQSMNWANGALLATNLLDPKNRLDQIIAYRLTTALSFGPPPTIESIIEQNRTLKEELDTTKISNDDLAARYKIREEEAGKMRQSELDKQAEIGRLEEARRKSEEDFNKKIADKQDTLNEVNNKLLAKQNEQIQHEKDVKALKEKAAGIVGLVSLLCVAAAIWSPVFKDKFGFAAVIFGLIAVSIIYIEGWMIAVGLGGLGLAAIVFFAVRNHSIEKLAATNTYRGLQEIKTKFKDEYDKVVAPTLASWQTKYDSAGNPVPDNKAIAHIDNTLIASGDK